MDSIFDFCRSLLQSMWTSFGFGGKEGTLLLLGLDNAGKTTLLHRLRTTGSSNNSDDNGEIHMFAPTDRPYQSDKFIYEGITFQGWDLGGHEAVRHLWADYICQCSAILFIVDASDRNRIEEVEYELDSLIADNRDGDEGGISDIPIAILFNKCDLPEAMSSEELCQRIKYYDLQAIHNDTGNNNDDDPYENGGSHANNAGTAISSGDDDDDYDIHANKNENNNDNNNQRIRKGTEKSKSKMAAFRISVLRGEGYQDAFRWVSTFL